MGNTFRGRFVAFFKPAAVLLSVVLLAAMAMGLGLAQPAWADDDSGDETYTVTVTGTYHQSDAYSMLAMINQFRTAEVDENDGNTPWAWSSDNKTKVHYDNLKELKWSTKLEKIAMQRAAELVVRYEHERPNGRNASTTYTSDGSLPLYSTGENITIGTKWECGSIVSDNDFSAKAAFESWREDDELYDGPTTGQGHRLNMLRSWPSIGIACFEHNGVRYWAMEVADFTDSEQPSKLDASRTVEVETLSTSLSSFNFETIDTTLRQGQSLTLPTTISATYGYSWDNVSSHKAEIKAAVKSEWEYDDGDLLKINGNKLIALKAGETSLFTTVAGRSVQLNVSIVNKLNPSITCIDETKTVKLSDALTLSPKCDSDAKPSFKSSNESVAAVDADGKVTLKKMGYADITVSYAATEGYEAASKTCKLTVVDDAANVPSDGNGYVEIYVPGQSNANVTVTPAASAPAKTVISKLMKAKKAFTVNWKKRSGVAGYQVRYSLKSSMKGAKTVTVKSAKATSKKVTKLKKKKKYYVQVRTYKVVNGKTYWSGWSAKKSVKTK